MSTTPQPTTEDLRAAAVAAEQQPQPTEPVVQEIEGIKYGKTPEGKFFAELPTGSKYVGDNEQQLAVNIAKGKAEADRTLRQWKEEHQAPPPTQPQVDPTVQQAREYLLNEIAAGVGLGDGKQLISYLGQIGQVSQEQINQNIAAGFQQLCPDFPESEANNEKLLDFAEQNGFPYSPVGLQAAHNLLVQRGAYKPLTPEQIQAQRLQALQINPQSIAVPTPAPMIPSQSSQVPNVAPNPYDRKNVSLDALRQAALEAERR